MGGKAAPLHWTNNERREAVLQAGVSYGGTDRIPGVAEPRSLTKYLAGAALARSISTTNPSQDELDSPTGGWRVPFTDRLGFFAIATELL